MLDQQWRDLALALPVALAGLFALRPWRAPRAARGAAWLALCSAALCFLLSRGEPRRASAQPARPLRWVALIDASPSITAEDRRRQAAFLDQLALALPPHVTLERKPFGEQPRPGESTRLAPALLAAAGADRVFLLSDGQFEEPPGELVERARRLGAPIDLPAHFPAPRGELVPLRLTLLEQPTPDRQALLALSFHAEHDGAARLELVLRRAGDPPRALPPRALLVRPGEHTVQGRLPPLQPGLYLVEARLFPPGAPDSPRQRLALQLEVGRAPRVLLASDDPAGGLVGRVLRRSRHQIDRVRPSELPRTAEGYLPYRAVVLVDLPLAALAPPAAAALAGWVRASGGGLLLAGAREALEAERFEGPLAELLPLAPAPAPPERKQPPPKRKENPDPRNPDARPQRGKVARPVLALMLVIDRSGSMQEGQKLALAREGAIACAETLHDGDLLGVVAFDGAPHVLVRPTPASRRRKIVDLISQLKPGGDTNIYRALQMGGRLLRGSDCPVKHLVLLSDGHTEPALFRPLVRQLAQEGVTISTIGIGQDFDQRLMQSLARWGKGQFYFATDPQQIPQYVVRETRQALRRAAPHRKQPRRPPQPETTKKPDEKPDREPTNPVHAVFRAPFLVGLSGRFPALGRVAATRVRPGATVFLETAGKAPVLAAWRAGLGRAGVFSGTLSGPGAGEWPRWREAPRLAAQLVSFLLAEEQAAEPLALDSRLAWLPDGRLRLDLRLSGPDGRPRAAPITVRNAAGGAPLAAPREISPGRYRLEAALDEQFTLLAIQAGRLERHLLAHRPLPLEQRPPRPDHALLARLSAKSGGRTGVLPQPPYVPPPARRTGSEPLDVRPLLAAGLVLWCIAIGLWRGSGRD